jgi:hypothetical protein
MKDEKRAADDAEQLTLDALFAAQRFIENGIEFGYIKMPSMEIDDAHQTLPLVQKALAAYQAALSSRADGGKGSSDAARIDWLEQEDEMGFYYNIDHISANINGGFNGFKTLREAIDAAIAGEKK